MLPRGDGEMTSARNVVAVAGVRLVTSLSLDQFNLLVVSFLVQKM
jgi:hypothetical protein